MSDIRKRWWLLLLFLFFFFFIAGFGIGSVGKIRLPFALPRRSPFKLKPAQVVANITKTKTVTTQGGNIQLIDASGTSIRLYIPQNAVDKDTDITFSAIAEIPIENYDAGEDAPNVLISPINLHLAIPARLSFDFNPSDDAPNITGVEIPPQITVTPPPEEPLTPGEQERRSQARPRRTSSNGRVIHTNSQESQAGSLVIISPTTRTGEDSIVETPVTGGGSYSYDNEVIEEEAAAFVEEILNNPNATTEQILEAASVAQGFGFDDLDGRAKNRLKEKVQEAKDQIKKDCQENTKPLARTTILRLTSLAQELGFDVEAGETEQLLELCKKRYSVNFSTSAWGRTDAYSGVVCGFIDDQWEMNITLTYQQECGGGSGAVDPFPFTLAAGGGATSNPFIWVGWATVCNTSSSLTHTPSVLNTFYDGNTTVQFYSEWIYMGTAVIQQESSCGNGLPPLKPIPTNVLYAPLDTGIQ